MNQTTQMKTILITALMLVGFSIQAQSTLGLNPDTFDIFAWSLPVLIILAILYIWLLIALLLAPLFIWKWTKRTARELNALRSELQIMNADKGKRY